MVGQSLDEQGIIKEQVPGFYSVKEAVFPFIKFPGVDTVLGPEMKSTGEVMGIGETFGEAFEKAQNAASYTIPRKGNILFSLRRVIEGRPHVVDMIKNNEIHIVVNTTSGKQSLKDSYTIRREALLHKVTYYTTMAAARASSQAHQFAGSITVNQLQELHKKINHVDINNT
jgi:carbamoyl-phosphate synthase large subunit